jgi:hypothetical protein
MNSLDTTNVILAVMAATTVAQFLVVLSVFVWMGRRVAALQQTVARFESTHLAALAERTNGVIADLRVIANRADRVGAELERTAHGLQAILKVVELEVTRTTRGVHQALDVVSGGYRQLFAVGSGLRDGVRELMTSRRQRQERRLDVDAEKRFEAGA